MSLNMFWFLPTHGDGRYLGTEEGARPVDYGYLQQIAQTADRLGFTGVLIPTGRSCEDAWLVAASMIPVTQRLKFLVAGQAWYRRRWPRVRRRPWTGCQTAGRCSIWSPAAILPNWQATASSSTTPSAMRPRLNLPTSGVS